MKRAPIKRKKAMRRPRPTPRQEVEELRRRLFRASARLQRKFCQCRTSSRAHAHHVLYEQHAKVEGANPHDVRNAMLVCGHCHFQHHKGVARIPAAAIPELGIEFLREVLGPDRAVDYLTRYYG